MKNKSSITTLMLLFIFAFSPAYARLYVDQDAMKLRRENDIASYATTYLGYYGEQEKNPQKCVAILKLIEDNERAKLFLAYCYEEGLGVEKDSAKAQEYLDEIKGKDTVGMAIENVLSGLGIQTLALRIADFTYEKLGNARDSYYRLLSSSYLKNYDIERQKQILAIFEENPKEYADVLFEQYEFPKDKEKLFGVIEYLDYSKIQKYKFSNFFYKILKSGDLESLEKILKNKAFLEAFNNFESGNMSTLSLHLAYCKKYGIGIEKDEAEADKIVENFVDIPRKNKSNSYELESIHQIPFEGSKDFLFEIAKKLKEKDDFALYITCIRRGWGVELNGERAMELNYEIFLKDGSESAFSNIISDFVDLYLKGESNKRVEEIAYDVISKNLATSNNYYVSIYYNLILLGYGDESDKAKIFEHQKGISYRNPSDIFQKEKLAYFYDNGIGTPQDSEKAKALRQEIEESVLKENPEYRYSRYYNLANSPYSKDKVYLRGIYAPEMVEYYTKKANEFRIEKDCANISKEDKALMREFKEIFDTFFDENKKAIGNNKLLVEQKKRANAFFKKVIESESKAIVQIAKYALPYPAGSKGLGYDSLNFRVLALAHFVKASEYCPELYPIVAYCYKDARACRGDKKIAGDFYLKNALYLKGESEKSSAFRSAFNLYKQIGDYDSMKIIVEKIDELLPPSIVWDISKAHFYLMESPYKDVEYARVLIEKIKEAASDEYDYRDIICSENYDYLELGELQFWAAQKYYDASEKKTWGFINRLLISGYTNGLYVEKDLDKAIGLLLEYEANATEQYNSHSMIRLAHYMVDVEDKNEEIFRNTLEALLKIKPNSAALNFTKALAIDKGFAYAKDDAQRDLYLEKSKDNEYLLQIVTQHYNLLQPSNELLEKLTELTPNKSSRHRYSVASAYTRLGNLEEAAKYAEIYDKTATNDYFYKNAVYLILNGESPESLAKRYSKLNQRGQNLIYATMLYDGFGVDKNKEKALELFKKLDKNWMRASGDDARIWLWKYYTENGNLDLAQALVDPKTVGNTLYNSKSFVEIAEIFQDKLDMKFIGSMYNLPKSDEHSKYFLELAESKYFSDYATELLDFYGTNPTLSNLEKKQEVRKKAREILTKPKPSKKEEVNYPKKEDKHIINRGININ